MHWYQPTFRPDPDSRPTARKRHMWERKILDALPYSLAQMPAYQPDWAAELAKRDAAHTRWQREARDRKAATWRAVRARFYALPAADRAAIRAEHSRRRWLASGAGGLAYLIEQHEKLSP